MNLSDLTNENTPLESDTYEDGTSPITGLTPGENIDPGTLSEVEDVEQGSQSRLRLNNFSESELGLLQEYHDRGTALSSIAAYAKWMKRSGLPFFDFEPAPHHVPILDALEALERGDIQRLMITVPPGHGKSHWANIVFLSWLAARHPEWGILGISARLDLAIDFARKRRQILASPEWSLLSGVSPDPKLTAPEFIPYGPTGYMRAASVGQGIAGKRCDFLATDDAIASAEEASSPAMRDKMFRWYIDEARTRARLERGSVLRELFIGTRWWVDDLQGRLLESEGNMWHLIEMPLLCTDPENDVMKRKLGEPLWDAFPPQRILEVQRDPVSFQSLYQQRPMDAAGDWLDPETITVHDTIPALQDLSIYCAMDLATSDSAKSDFTCIGIIGVDHERNLWIVDWFRERINPEDAVTKLREIRKKYDPIEYLVDNDLGSKYFARLARVMALQSGQVIVPREIPTGNKSKLERAIAFQGLARMGCVRTKAGPWVGELKREISTFPREGAGYFDDQIDVLSLFANYMMRIPPGRAPSGEPKKPEPIIAGVSCDASGKLHTTQTLDELWADNRSIRMGIRRI